MTQEQQRIAIGEACPDIFEIRSYSFAKLLWWRDRMKGTTVDPLSDLNAMAEAEKRLSARQVMVYDRFLAEITQGFTWSATAAQRAEAFLRTIGKWVD